MITFSLHFVFQDGELWVLLVAGSNGWFNYRHQADVCHAYQIVHAHGVPDDHIIVMMYDDIAYNIENPTPGKIINHPKGTDVYQGVPKDYACGSVRPDIFLQVNLFSFNVSLIIITGSPRTKCGWGSWFRKDLELWTKGQYFCLFC